MEDLSIEETGAITDFLGQLDRDGAQLTEGPEADPEGLLTEGPEGEDETQGPEDEETGALFDLKGTASAMLSGSFKAELDKLTAQLSALAKGQKKGGFTPKQAAQMLLLARKSTPKTIPAPKRPAPSKRPPAVPPPTPGMVRRRKELYEIAKRRYKGDLIIERGFYYSVGEFIMDGVGDGKRHFLIARAQGDDASVMTFFHESIDETSTRLGNSYRVSVSDTNLRRPGRTSYLEQIFLIESISAEFRGLRARYTEKAISDAGFTNPDIVSALSGKSYLFDDSTLILPGNIFRDDDGVCELERALHGAGILKFRRRVNEAGDNSNSNAVLIDTWRHIPIDRQRESIRETSGAAPVLDYLNKQEGFLWSLDPENPDLGEFNAMVELREDFVFPVKAVDLGSGTEVIPEQIALYFALRVHGIGIRPRKSQLREIGGKQR